MYLRETPKHALLVCLVFIAANSFLACNSHPKKPGPTGFSDEAFIKTLKAALIRFDTSDKRVFRSVADDVRFTYQYDEYQPIWVKENYKPVDAAAKVIDELEDTYWDGLDTVRYNLAVLRRLKTKLDTTKNNSVADAVAFDTALTHFYLLAAKDLLIGRISPNKADSLWYHVNDSNWTAPQLLVEGKGNYPSLNDFRSEVPTYKLLRDEYRHFTELASDSTFRNALANIKPVRHPDSEMTANINTVIGFELPWLKPVPNDSVSEKRQMYMGYQNFRGLPATGRPDSTTLASLATPVDTFLKEIGANMERIRWMQRQFGSLYLVVDVPLMELFLRKDGVNVMHMRVVVGRPERQTPSFFATMANVVINPQWGVPPTILRKDVLPGLQKSGKKYMDKKGLKAYDNEGKRVNVSTINSSNYRRYNYKQAPGDDNSLGYVKFNLPNKWDIYLHDTPHRSDFGKRFRALSSGCIRLQRPQDMAVYILSELEKRSYTQGKLDTIIKTHRTRWELLKTKIPVHIAYLTAFEDTTGKHIQFSRDIYHRDDKLISLLN